MAQSKILKLILDIFGFEMKTKIGFRYKLREIVNFKMFISLTSDLPDPLFKIRPVSIPVFFLQI